MQNYKIYLRIIQILTQFSIKNNDNDSSNDDYYLITIQKVKVPTTTPGNIPFLWY